MRRTLSLSLALALSLLACPPKSDAPAGDVATPEAVQRVLTERARRLTSLQLEVETTLPDEAVRSRFSLRAPDLVRAVRETDQGSTVAFDGERLYRLEPSTKTLEVTEPPRSPAQRARFLEEAFNGFAPDGYLLPALPTKGVTVMEVAHPLSPRAAAVTVRPRGGETSEVTYILRWPSGDFLSRRVAHDGALTEVSVAEERCDKALRLCVPMKLTERVAGIVGRVTRVTDVSFNPELPVEDFRLSAPEGYSRTEGVADIAK